MNFQKIISKSGIILLTISAIIALFTFDEYGISWDEGQQRSTGEISYKYIFSDDTYLLSFYDRDYGVAFELPLIIIEKSFGLVDSRSIYLMRHLVTHFFFLIGCYFFFLLIDKLYKNKFLATVGFLLLISHPGIYSHSFFNTKDLPFLSMFIISIFFSIDVLEKKDWKSSAILGLCLGLLLNIRLMGVIMPLIVIFFIVFDGISEKNILNNLKSIIVLLFSTCLVLYASWPFLWSDPIDNFVFAFENMSNFRWEGEVLFRGQRIGAKFLDWTYLPIWFTITTPLFYVLIGFMGCLTLIVIAIKDINLYFKTSIERHNLIFLAYFISPFAAVILLHSTLYDTWRQAYFIYPPFVLLCIYMVNKMMLLENVYNVILKLFLGFSILITCLFSIIYFPIQTVYFNELFWFRESEYLRKNYEFDYWGVSFKQSLEYILERDSSSKIPIAVENSPGLSNLNILSLKNRERVEYVDRKEAKYFIAHFRGHTEDYTEYEANKFHSIKVLNSTVSQIYKFY